MFSLLRRRVTPPVFRWFALATFISMILIVLSGAAVRLTGSGLGCPTGPPVFRHYATNQWSIHSKIEFGNRLVTVLLFCVVGATFVAALRRVVVRRDLIILSGLLIGGIVADAVLGAFVVYSKLNPWLVSLHMLLSLAMVVIAAIRITARSTSTRRVREMTSATRTSFASLDSCGSLRRAARDGHHDHRFGAARR